LIGGSSGTARLMADNGAMEDYIGAGILMGALAGFMLLRRVLTNEAQFDRRWILLVMGAVVISVAAGILIGSLLNPN
jgi:hypothetical protein